jgi:hypothetical protein
MFGVRKLEFLIATFLSTLLERAGRPGQGSLGGWLELGNPFSGKPSVLSQSCSVQLNGQPLRTAVSLAIKLQIDHALHCNVH